MIDTITRYFDAPARALIAAIFVLSGLGKIGTFAATQGYMQAYGLNGALLVPTILFELGAGLLLLLGLGTRVIALALAGFCLISAAVFHRDLADQMQMIMFLKNLAMTGGLLLLAKHGAPGFSLDRLIAARRGA